MNKQTEAIKLAIEVFGDGNWHDEIVDTDWADKANNTITALREALEKEALHKLAAESLTEGLRLDDWPKIGCVNHDCDKCKAQQEQWDAIPDAFNEWWNADYDDTGNPYRKDSPAYWAWSGWKAASKQPAQQEPVAMRMPKVGDEVVCIEDDSLGTVAYLTAGGSPEIKFDDGSHGTYLLHEFAELFRYTTQQPPAQPMTDEQIEQLEQDTCAMDFPETVRAIEAAHGITKGNT